MDNKNCDDRDTMAVSVLSGFFIATLFFLIYSYEKMRKNYTLKAVSIDDKLRIDKSENINSLENNCDNNINCNNDNNIDKQDNNVAMQYSQSLTEIQHVDGLPDDHITWHEFFMSFAQLASKRSKDPVTKVGACIVNGQNKIVGTGYNGMPNRVNDRDVPWVKMGDFLDTKYAYVVHAELNAILNCILTDQSGCRLFVSLFPCNECAKAIIQSGIRHVIYLSDKHKEKDSTKAAKILFGMAGVRHEQFNGRLLIN